MGSSTGEPESSEAARAQADAWWADRERAYRDRPDVRREIGRLGAAAQQHAARDYARAAGLERRVQAGVPGAEQALYDELTLQALETGPAEPSAKNDPAEWIEFFRHEYGRDMPLNAAYEAERHRIEAAAPPDVGGMAAAYLEANYPVGFDHDELAAERQGITLDELDAQRYGEAGPETADEAALGGTVPAPGAGHRSHDPGSASRPRPGPGAADWPGTVSDGVAAVAARGGGVVSQVAKAIRRAAGQVRGPRPR